MASNAGPLEEGSTDLQSPDLEMEVSVEEGDLEGEPTRIEHLPVARVPRASAAEAAAEPRLVVVHGNDRGKEFRLNKARITIGRGLDNDIVLGDIAVSRRHTELMQRGGFYHVLDIGSGNGIVVNGERTDDRALKNHDQIELGNTLLRFVHPASASQLAQAATQLHDPDECPEVVEEPPPQRAVRRGPTTAIEALPQTHSSRSRRLRRLVIFGGLAVVLFLAAMGALKYALDAKQATPEHERQASAQQATKHLKQGARAFTDRRWKEALDHYQEVLRLSPTFSNAKRYIKQTEAEIAAQSALQASKDAFAQGDFELAKEQARVIPSASVYFAEARQLMGRIDDQHVASLLVEAQRLDAAGDQTGALKATEAALALQPSNAVAEALRERLNVALGRQVVPEVKPKKKVVKKRHVARAPALNKRPILTAYAAKQWDRALAAVDEQLAGSRGKGKRTLKKWAASIRLVADRMKKGQAVQARDPAQAIRHYLAALKADRQLQGGRHQPELKSRLRKVARIRAMTAMAGGRYQDAYRAIKVARSIGPLDAGLKSVVGRLSKEAASLNDKAYTLRRRNPAKARELWQRVLRIVPPSSKSYQDAYSWLNTSKGRAVDEDEDS